MSPRVPASPAGILHKDFGFRLWGSGADDARRRIETITQEELDQLGLTVELAKAWRDFYAECAQQGRGSDTAEARCNLMQHCVELLQAS